MMFLNYKILNTFINKKIMMNFTQIKYCLALDLKNDEKLIQEYKEYHKYVWPEIKESLKDSGVTNMEIYNHGTRMFMIMEVNDHYLIENK